MSISNKINDLKQLLPGSPASVFKQYCNCEISIKTPSIPFVHARFEKERMQFLIYEGPHIPTGVTIVDEHENKFCVRNVETVLKEYENKKGEKIQCKLLVIDVVYKEPDCNSLLTLVKQEAINNSNIQIIAEGDVHIVGDVGSISLIQKLDLQSYWNYLKNDILNLFDSKSFSPEIEEIDDYFVSKRPVEPEKIKKSFKKIVLDSIRNFALDFLVKLTVELSKMNK